MLKFKMIILLFVSVLLVTGAQAAPLSVDRDNSNILFRVAELDEFMVGSFSSFGGTIDFDQEKNQLNSVKFDVNVISVDSGNTQRDIDFLKSELFDAQNNPTATFVSKKINDKKITGELTLHGKTRKVDVEYQLSQTEDNRVLLLLRTKINRQDFGITYNRILEKGKPLIGDEVEIQMQAVTLPK